MKKNNKQGISLIVLVITIIIMIILAAVVVITLKEAGIIGIAETGTFKQNLANWKTELEVYVGNETVENKGRYNRELLNATMKKGVYGEDKIFDENGDGTSNLLDVLESIKDTKWENALYVKEGKIVFKKSKLTGTEIELAQKAGYEIDVLEIEEVNEESYIQDGLIIQYDGENNTGNGHDSSATTWKNISKTPLANSDGTLVNINYNETSGWTDNSLILDGSNDIVKSAYAHYPQMTIEIVFKPLDALAGTTEDYIANFETGGMGILKVGNNLIGQAYVGGSYKAIGNNGLINIGKTYSVSLGYDGTNMYYLENGELVKLPVTGAFTAPKDSTLFMLGTNPEAKGETLGSNEVRPNFEAYSVRIYNRCLTEEEMKYNYQVDSARYEFDAGEEVEQGKLGYVEDGLLVLYDAIKNTNFGHSKKTNTWIDLSGNGYNATIVGKNNTAASGWTNNSLVLDGSNDWVKIKYLHYANMTIEVVAKPLKTKGAKAQFFIANRQNGGSSISIWENSIGAGFVIGGTMQECTVNMELMKKYSMSVRYDGSAIHFRANDENTTKAVKGTYTKPGSSTIYALATNPEGTSEYLTTSDARANIEVYSVRIYNRALTEAEVEQNYQVDKQRFGI